MNTATMTKPADDTPVTVHFLGNLVTFVARAADTDDSFSIVECLTAPGAGAPMHSHAEAEGFLVTEGEFTFMIDGQTRLGRPGEFLFVRPRQVHRFENSAEKPSKMLIFSLPGGGHERFFLAVGEPLAAGSSEFPPMSPPDIPRLVEIAARTGITILPPPAA